jgi:hypothetical protein
VIRDVGVEPPLDGARGYPQCPAPHRRLDRLEVQALAGARAYERLDLSRDFRVEGLFEAPLLPASSEVASPASSFTSQSWSLVSTSSRTKARKRRCSAICSRVWATAPAGITRVIVFPPTSRVSDQLGP